MNAHHSYLANTVFAKSNSLFFMQSLVLSETVPNFTQTPKTISCPLITVSYVFSSLMFTTNSVFEKWEVEIKSISQ